MYSIESVLALPYCSDVCFKHVKLLTNVNLEISLITTILVMTYYCLRRGCGRSFLRRGDLGIVFVRSPSFFIQIVEIAEV